MQDSNIKKLWHTNRKCFIEKFSILQTINSEGEIEHTYFEYNPATKELEKLPTCQIIEIKCTGFKENTGKLVFEGDIVKVSYNGGQIPLFDRTYKEQPEPEIFYIRYSEEWQTYFCRNINASWCSPPFDYLSKTFERQLYPQDADVNNRVTLGKAILVNNCNKFSQVIGNIYENPELLEEKE